MGVPIFYDFPKTAGLSMDLGEVFNRITEALQGVFNLEACSLMLWDEEKTSLYYAVVYNLSEQYLHFCASQQKKQPFSPSLLALQQRKPLYISNIFENELFAPWREMASKEGYAAFISIPLYNQDLPIGVINAYLRKPHIFDEDELRLVTLLASQVAITIDNIRLNKELRTSYLDTIKALVYAMEAKDQFSRGHSERVTKYSLLIARTMGLPSPQRELLAQAGALHDIGKISIDLSILHKPTKLSAEEMNTIYRHPEVGYNIIRPIEFLKDVRNCIREHHEHYNGGGYPSGIKGEQILLESRILTVADAFDAMTTMRPYRRALTQKEALTELERCAGSQFDPQIITSFTRSLKR